uniref:Uncharacterized protein n=1 Tax=Rhizophora mucronata TaxID=61149 RepID=A0A2P2NG38_RHIMU
MKDLGIINCYRLVELGKIPRY